MDKANLIVKFDKAKAVCDAASAIAEKHGGGRITDGDNILAEYINDVEPGMFDDMYRTFNECKDMDTFTGLFFLLTGIELEEYLDRCIEETHVTTPGGTTYYPGKISIPNEPAKKQPEIPVMPGDKVFVITNKRILNRIGRVYTTQKLEVYPATVTDTILSLGENNSLDVSVNLTFAAKGRIENTTACCTFYVNLENVPVSAIYRTEEDAMQALVAKVKKSN